jgi:hypothetical protein
MEKVWRRDSLRGGRCAAMLCLGLACVLTRSAQRAVERLAQEGGTAVAGALVNLATEQPGELR